MSEVITRSADTIHLFDTPLLLCRNQGMTLEQRIAKRCMDLLISCIGLLLASPFMIITALAIKLCDKGPVFFKQERLTIGGKIFYVYKFRSMYVDAEKDGVARLASQHDDRITPVGKIIRKVRLDELPQLLNVLKGDMSLVGPRPERPEIAAAYAEEMPEFSFRLKVKAGLTGYAQVYGKYNTTPVSYTHLAEASQLVLDAAAKGLDACIVHPSGIIGPGDWGHGHLTQMIIDYLDGRLVACVNGCLLYTSM